MYGPTAGYCSTVKHHCIHSRAAGSFNWLFFCILMAFSLRNLCHWGQFAPGRVSRQIDLGEKPHKVQFKKTLMKNKIILFCFCFHSVILQFLMYKFDMNASSSLRVSFLRFMVILCFSVALLGLQQSCGLVGAWSSYLWNGCWLPSFFCWSAYPNLWKDCVWQGVRNESKVSHFDALAFLHLLHFSHLSHRYDSPPTSAPTWRIYWGTCCR